MHVKVFASQCLEVHIPITIIFNWICVLQLPSIDFLPSLLRFLRLFFDALRYFSLSLYLHCIFVSFSCLSLRLTFCSHVDFDANCSRTFCSKKKENFQWKFQSEWMNERRKSFFFSFKPSKECHWVEHCW